MVARFTGKTALISWLLLASMLIAGSAFAAVSAHVGRQVIGEGETVNLTIDVSGGDSGEPDTAPLQRDFEILSRSHSSSYSLINGSMHSSDSWQFTLQPRHTGPLTIPPIQVGKSHTQPIALQVKQTAARKSPDGHPSGDIWLDMRVQPQTVLVQQQAIISIKIYQAVTMAQAQLSEPKAANAVIERLSKDEQYQVTENGQDWNVTERKYAVFPQQSGVLSIKPVQLDATVMLNQQVFGSPFFQSSQPIRVRSNALTLKVSPIPATWHGSNWLPSSGVKLTENWPEGKTFKVGEPISRTLTLQAQGLSSSQLPALPDILPNGLKTYPDQPALSDSKSDQGIVGIRQEKIAIIPTLPGTYILPAIAIPWWNVNSGKMETAQLPPRTFKVVGIVMPGSASLPTQASPAQPVPPQRVITAPPHVTEQAGWWKTAAIIFACGWLLTLLFWLVKVRKNKSRNGSGNDVVQIHQAESLKSARQAVTEACKHNDAKACELALMKLSAIRWPETGGGLQALCALGNDDLDHQISLLEQHLYSAGDQPWQGDELLRVFEQADFNSADKKAARQAIRLPGLYPDQ